MSTPQLAQPTAPTIEVGHGHARIRWAAIENADNYGVTIYTEPAHEVLSQTGVADVITAVTLALAVGSYSATVTALDSTLAHSSSDESDPSATFESLAHGAPNYQREGDGTVEDLEEKTTYTRGVDGTVNQDVEAF